MLCILLDVLVDLFSTVLPLSFICFIQFEGSSLSIIYHVLLQACVVDAIFSQLLSQVLGHFVEADTSLNLFHHIVSLFFRKSFCNFYYAIHSMACHVLFF
jgi:hypothetical protein